MSQSHYQDILIIGGGAAGLTLALQLGEHLRVGILCKGPTNESSTYYAQGGIAAVLDDDDSVDQHVADTLAAGAGLCRQPVVQHTVEHSAAVINWLIEQGVPFTPDTGNPGGYHLNQEGGHSQRRIIHAADATGKAVSETLTNNALKHPNIKFYPHRIAVDLIPGTSASNTCQGAYVLDDESGSIDTFNARFTVLATGGASKVYLYSSNPDVASGDGIAMAWRAGCRVGNMEFNQFHPTCLYHPLARSFLITEALRGEGGVLRLPSGERFMPRFDARAELAPRDVVARAIDHEIKRLGIECVYLDITHKPDTFITSHFPTVYQRCLQLGIDITRELIPVVPAAHYTCGGVVVDLQGNTDVDNLYAIGETAFTGLHGANRMASNSLLECLVWGSEAASNILSKSDGVAKPIAAPAWDESKVTDSDEDVVIAHNWAELRRFMWDYVGIVRTTKRLQRAKHRIELLQEEIAEYYSNYRISGDLIELRNLSVVAQLVIESASRRKESRGLHYTQDYPDTLAQARDTILTPPNN
jgi:L-aspartate oxidase